MQSRQENKVYSDDIFMVSHFMDLQHYFLDLYFFFNAEVWNPMENNKDSIRMQLLLCQRGGSINQSYTITANS